MTARIAFATRAVCQFSIAVGRLMGCRRRAGASDRQPAAAAGRVCLLVACCLSSAVAAEDESSERLRAAQERRAEGLADFDAGHYESALEHLQASLDLYQRAYPDIHYPQGNEDLVEAEYLVGMASYQLRRLAGFLRHCQRAAEIAQDLYDDKDDSNSKSRLAHYLHGYASSLEVNGDHESAREWYQKELAIIRSIYPRETYPDGHIETAFVLRCLARTYRTAGDLKSAQKHAAESLTILRKLRDSEAVIKEIDQLLLALNTNGEILVQLGMLKEATGCYTEALRILREQNTNDMSVETLVAMALISDHLGDIAIKQGNFASAKEHFEAAQQTRKRIQLRMPTSVGLLHLIESDRRLCRLAVETGRWNDAIELAQKVVDYFVNLFPSDEFPNGHIRLAIALNDLATIQCQCGEIPEARRNANLALSMVNRLGNTSLPTSSVRFAATTTLANADTEMGDFASATRYGQDALEYCLADVATTESIASRSRLADAYSSLAYLKDVAGQPDEALDAYMKALDIERQLTASVTDAARQLNLVSRLQDVASCLIDMGRFDEADSYFKELSIIAEPLFDDDRLGKNHIQKALILVSLAGRHEVERDYVRAHQCYSDALRIFKAIYDSKSFPKGHRHISGAMSNLGRVKAVLGDSDGAERLLKDSLSMRRELYGFGGIAHPWLIRGLRDLAIVYLETGERTEAISLLDEAAQLERGLLMSFMPLSSEAESLALAERYLESIEIMVASVHEDSTGRFATTIYKHVWEQKALLRRIVPDRNRRFRDHASRESEEYATLTERLGKLLAASLADPEDSQHRLDSVTHLAMRREKLEKQLAAELSWKPEFSTKPFDDLIRRMPRTMAYIDFVSYSHPAFHTSETKRGYAAFVLTVDGIDMVSLGDTTRVDALVTMWIDSIEGERESSAGHELSRQVWKPIAESLPSDARTLVVSPCGALAAIPWYALKHNGRLLIEDYTVTVVPDGHLLLEQLDNSSEVKTVRRVVAFAHDAGNRSGGSSLEKQSLPILPGTHRELRFLDDVLADGTLMQIKGDQAKASELLEQIGGAQVLHIATHGYFLPRDVRTNSESARPSRLSAVMARNPYFAAGVILSNSNTDESGHYEVLTGDQVASRSLSSLELVVLSACNSGIGKSVGREGMYSLQRAFHAAGSKNVVVSLWPVDDDYASLIMRRFYSNLLIEEQSVADALRLAQLEVMKESQVSTKLTRGPRFSSVPVKGILEGTAEFPTRHWAGFVVSGLGGTRLSSKAGE